LVLFASSCTFTGLAFEQDERLDLQSPPDRAKIHTPYTFRWSMDNFRVAASGSEVPSRRAGYFTLFFDRAPVRPNTALDTLATNDILCRRAPNCPNDAWFNQRHIFRTTDTSLRIEGLPDTRPKERPEAPDRHELTIVLVDTADVRIGESAWKVDFFVDRGEAP
jgi:hypothetical protein